LCLDVGAVGFNSFDADAQCLGNFRIAVKLPYQLENLGFPRCQGQFTGLSGTKYRTLTADFFARTLSCAFHQCADEGFQLFFTGAHREKTTGMMQLVGLFDTYVSTFGYQQNSWR
jgi:hypothetical protein